jgi:hypothetical protein
MLHSVRGELDSCENQKSLTKQGLHELAVEKFNDPSWTPIQESYPLLHSDFAQPIECPKEKTMTWTAEKSKRMLQSMKTSSPR